MKATTDSRIIVFHPMDTAILGGSERTLILIIDATGNERFRHVVTLPEDGPLADQLASRGVETHIIPRSHRHSVAYHTRLALLMHSIRPHILHVQDSRIEALSARLLGVKIFERKNITREDYHGAATARFPLLDKFLNSLADRTVFPSEFIRDYYVSRGLVSAGKTRVIYNGLDLTRFDAPFDHGSTLASIGATPDDILIICVGRLVPLKAYGDAIAAMPGILTKFPAAKLLITGDGPEAEKLKNQAVQSGLKEQIIFTGNRNDVLSLLQCSRAFLHPSHTEALSNAILEAMAARCPVAVADIPGNTEIVAHDKTGLLFEPGNTRAISDAVIRILNGGETPLQITANARTLIENKFQFSVMGAAFSEEYSKLAGQHGVRSL